MGLRLTRATRLRQYVLYRTYASALMTWVIPVIMLLFGPFFLIAAWNSPEDDRIVGIVFGVAWSFGVLWLLIWMLRLPRRIELHEHGLVVFQGPLRRLNIQASEISSIKPGGSQLGFLVLKHSGGRLRLLNQFDGFHDFLTRLKESNPGIELRGC